MKVRPTNSPGPRTAIAQAITLTRGEKVIAFIEAYCLVPEGALVGQKIVLEPFQRKFILDVYDNPHGTKTAILSIGRKNGKTALIAGICLAHIMGPEARLNSQICSGALSRDQASLVFKLMCKMIQMNPALMSRARIVPSSKTIIGISKNVEFRALAAEGKTAHGLSPVLAILDELGQVRGPTSDFIDAITTAQGAHLDAMVMVISTQAPNDNDMLSIWIDDAQDSGDPHTVCHVYSADKDCALDDPAAWLASNPALGIFRSKKDVEEQAGKAMRMPSFEPTFRNLVLNQRVEMVAPFISRGVWIANSSDPANEAFYKGEVYFGLDLSARNDLTAMVAAAAWEGEVHLRAWFWTPEKGLRDRSKTDRAPYDVWVQEGFIRAVPGASIDYEVVARDVLDALDGMNIVHGAFDRWRFDLLAKEFKALGVSIEEETGDLPMKPFGQGFKDMAPALDAFEALLLNEQVRHGGNPVLTMCMANARVVQDPAGNRKLDKAKATGRIDGAVAAAMAVGVMPATRQKTGPSVYEKRGLLTI